MGPKRIETNGPNEKIKGYRYHGFGEDKKVFTVFTNKGVLSSAI